MCARCQQHGIVSILFKIICFFSFVRIHFSFSHFISCYALGKNACFRRLRALAMKMWTFALSFALSLGLWDDFFATYKIDENKTKRRLLIPLKRKHSTYNRHCNNITKHEIVASQMAFDCTGTMFHMTRHMRSIIISLRSTKHSSTAHSHCIRCVRRGVMTLMYEII